MKNKLSTRARTGDYIKKIVQNKHSQGWGLDITIAGVIFLSGIIILYVYAINYTSQSQRSLEELFFEGEVASELILSDSELGILTENKVNQTKLEEYNANYSSKKGSIGITHNFYFYIDGLEIGGAPASYVGQINTTETDSNIQITRITIYKNKPSKFQLYVWK